MKINSEKLEELLNHKDETDLDDGSHLDFKVMLKLDTKRERRECAKDFVGFALGLLLRQSDEYNASGDIVGEREGFPFKPDDKWVGRWAGDEITIVGDYDTSLLFQWANVEYRDVSVQVQKMLNVLVASERMH